jgi:rhomboid protease GluP
MNTRAKRAAAEVILQTADPELAWTWSYVLTALRIPHQILNEDTMYVLLVPSDLKKQALMEIEGFTQEVKDRSAEPDNPSIKANKIQPPSLLLVGSLALFYTITGPWQGHSVWFQLGAGNSLAILEHSEWFRIITALTLHADTVHLLNNCVLGGFLLHFFLLLVGTGLGVFALLLAAAAGNYINVLVHGPGHIFVGFSTAIFAVIGMLSILRHDDKSHSIGSHALLPLMAGFALLAMLGSAGERTDLGAHFFGLLCGLATGKMLCVAILRKQRDSFIFQSILFTMAILIIFGSWVLALQRQ